MIAGGDAARNESRVSEAGGIRTPTVLIKSQLCYHSHHDLVITIAWSCFRRWRIRITDSLCSDPGPSSGLLVQLVVVDSLADPGIEPGTARISAGPGQPVRDCRQSIRRTVGQSSPRGSNPHPRGPKPRVLPSAPRLAVVGRNHRRRRLHAFFFAGISPTSTPWGNRTRHLRIESPLSCPVRRTRHICVFLQVAREALESSSPGLQPGAIPSQLPSPNFQMSSLHKKTRCRRDTGQCIHIHSAVSRIFYLWLSQSGFGGLDRDRRPQPPGRAKFRYGKTVTGKPVPTGRKASSETRIETGSNHKNCHAGQWIIGQKLISRIGFSHS